jgi:MazG family protein
MTSDNETLQKLIDTIRRLRGPDGCPWDRKQTAESLSQYLAAECEELLAAIRNNDPENICEELGDVLYLLIMIAEINKDQLLFQFSDVVAHVNAKLIRRHPHVFAGQSYNDEADLTAQWERIKAAEKEKKSN